MEVVTRRNALVIVALGAVTVSRCSTEGASLMPPTPTLPPRTAPSPPPNTIDSFGPDQATVKKGQPVTLFWAVSGTASYCKVWTGVEPGPRVLIADRLPLVGMLQVVPEETTWYGLVTYLADGRATLEADVQVVVE
jgi:hypothetical protein